MKTLNLYIIRHFLINFVILLTVLMLLFVMMDLILDMDEFWEGGRRWAQRRAAAQQAQLLDRAEKAIHELVTGHASAAEVAQSLAISPQQAETLLRRCQPGKLQISIGALWKVFDYYGPLILLLYIFFCGLIVTAAMGFAFTGLHRNGELTAMVAGGVSLYRVATPVVVVGMLLIGMTLPMQEFVIPALAAKLTRGKGDIKHETAPTVAVHYAEMGDGTLLSAADFRETQLTGVTILERDERGRTRRRIRADQALWEEAASRWQLIGGRAQRPSRMDAELGSELSPPSESIDYYVTDLSPTVLQTRRAGLYPQLLPMSQLQVLQKNKAVDHTARVDITRILWSRFSMLVLNVLILVMGLPFFLLRAPMNMLSQSVQAAGVCIGAWAGGIMLLQAGDAFLPPIAASWLPVVLILPISAFLLQTIRT
jgi:lipopolysaccharide export system permease protein